MKGIDDQGRLPEVVNQTIQDAITVVRELGKSYLWVDKYCVDQENHDIRDIQIREMDKIYACAYATIVASAGSNADFGLPGVNGVQRKKYPSVVQSRSKIEVFATCPPLSHAIADTAWITRGWTYQEAALSRRCLFFTTTQVYFVCPTTDFCEAIINNVGSAPESRRATGQRTVDTTLEPRRFLPLHTSFYDPSTQGSPLRTLAEHITEYSRRILTYETDILDSFLGLLSRSQFLTYYGIPVALFTHPFPSEWMNAKYFNMAFARGLFWTPGDKGLQDGRRSICRRDGFPSWSWIGWKGHVQYCAEWGPGGADVGTFMEPDEDRFDTKFWAENNKGRLSTLMELASAETTTRKLIPELSPFLVVEARVFQFRFQPYRYGQFKICACHCHLNSSHGSEATVIGGDEAIFCDPPKEANDLYQRMINRSWDCLLLFEDTRANFLQSNFLIIDWVGEIAYRVGVLPLRCAADRLKDVRYRRRRILLG